MFQQWYYIIPKYSPVLIKKHLRSSSQAFKGGWLPTEWQMDTHTHTQNVGRAWQICMQSKSIHPRDQKQLILFPALPLMLLIDFIHMCANSALHDWISLHKLAASGHSGPQCRALDLGQGSLLTAIDPSLNRRAQAWLLRKTLSLSHLYIYIFTHYYTSQRQARVKGLYRLEVFKI